MDNHLVRCFNIVILKESKSDIKCLPKPLSPQFSLRKMTRATQLLMQGALWSLVWLGAFFHATLFPSLALPKEVDQLLPTVCLCPPDPIGCAVALEREGFLLE